MKVFLMLHKTNERIYGIFTDETAARQHETSDLQAVEIELLETDAVKESHYDQYDCFFRIVYENQTYWFNAPHFGAALVELYLLLHRPENFCAKIQAIRRYYIFSEVLNYQEKYAMEWEDVEETSPLWETILQCVNDWNRDLCALCIHSITPSTKTKEELRAYQTKQTTYINGELAFPNSFEEASVEDIKRVCALVCGYTFLGQNDHSHEFACFWASRMRIKDKMEFLFWVFIYESCVGITKLPYLLYQSIMNNAFQPFSKEYEKKRPYFKDWLVGWKEGEERL